MHHDSDIQHDVVAQLVAEPNLRGMTSRWECATL